VKQKLGLLVLTFLRLTARLQLQKIRLIQKTKGKKLTIVGITGSAGKSSTINACQATLSDYFSVKTTAGSNSESGIPLNILGIKVSSFTPIDWLKYCLLAIYKLIANWQSCDVYLVEMGIDGPDEPKNMSYLLKIVRPDIGIFLNVNLTHSEAFDKTISRDIKEDQRATKIISAIGAEKAKMVNSISSSGYALLNTKDPTVLKTTLTISAHKIILEPIHLDFEHYAPPSDFDLSISAAINLAKLLGISISDAKKSIVKNLTLPPSRSSLLAGTNNSIIIDSSYNSSPLATTQMLDILKKHRSPRVAILGDMRELGHESATAHQKLYQSALKSADTIISVGPETSKYFGPKSKKFTYWWQVAEYLVSHPQLTSGATILVKGSQNTIYLEELVKELLENKSEASLLCRQSSYWLDLKAKFRKSNS
jgi:UDP-N-acetylmuramoyl-tripeptide--D-alanyl-D-alanine ligase